MSEQLYDIYYLDGLKPEITPTQAAARLVELTGVSKQQAQLLIASTDRVVKSGLSKDFAVRYLTALEQVGMRVEIRSPSGKHVATRPATDPPLAELDDDIIEAVKRKQESESTQNYDRTLK